MKTYVAFLRGINVGGQKNMLMADLKVLFETLGFTEVQTYIQSGNVVFLASESTEHASTIADTIENKYGFNVPVLVKTASEVEEILFNCPLSEEKMLKSYFVLLFETPSEAVKETLDPKAYPSEEFIITNSCVYLYVATGMGKAKCTNNFFERKLNVSATARNYRTMLKLMELSR